MSTTQCKYKDWFCYICGLYVIIKSRRKLTDKVMDAYSFYFGIHVRIGGLINWAPEMICTTCYTSLIDWYDGGKRHLQIKEPMIWIESVHSEDVCYFCVNKVFGYSSRTKKCITYSNVPSVIMAVPREKDDPIPLNPTNISPSTSQTCSDQPMPSTSVRSEFLPPINVGTQPNLIDQAYLNDMIRDLKLDAKQAEILSSRLRDKNLLTADVRITAQRKRHTGLMIFFEQAGDLVYCSNIEAVMEYLEISVDMAEWRLFMDSSKTSLKGVLLHNGNRYPALPIAYSKQTAETYENIQHLLNCIKYNEYKWNVIGDLKIVALVCGLQSGYTRHMCFLCKWNTRQKMLHYHQKNWGLRTEHVVGEYNVLRPPLVPQHKIILPPLHIKLGIVKNFVKALDPLGPAFQHLATLFPKLSSAKIKEGIFVGPQIKKLLKDETFHNKLSEMEKLTWDSMGLVIKEFLGNKRSRHYVENIENMLIGLHNIGASMSLKIHFLDSHLEFFAENLGAVSDEHGERFHQEISKVEERFKGKSQVSMLSEYIWGLHRELGSFKHSRQASYSRAN